MEILEKMEMSQTQNVYEKNGSYQVMNTSYADAGLIKDAFDNM